MKHWILLLLLLSGLGLVATPTLAQDPTPIPPTIVPPRDRPEGLPPITTSVMGETGEGYIYISSFDRFPPPQLPPDWVVYHYYLMVIDNEGNIIFSKPVDQRSSNFRSFPDGTMVYHHETFGGLAPGVAMDGFWVEMDGNGNEIGRYQMAGDHTTTVHEFLKLENGNVLLMSYPERIMDLTAYGGSPEAIVTGVYIQEQDPEGNVVWEWDGWEEFPLEDTTRPEQLTRMPPQPVDHIHPNALAIDTDGNILLSSRHLDEITKINRQTGEIMWRLGGKHSDFTFVNDPLGGFSGQHMPQITPQGTILIFDNGDLHQPPLSRAVEYKLDFEKMTATLVWSYTRGEYALALGSVQRLENGNTLIGWGAAPGVSVSEVDPAGNVVFELSLPPTQMSYRAYRLPFYGDLPQ
jgi:hypothetical protein